MWNVPNSEFMFETSFLIGDTSVFHCRLHPVNNRLNIRRWYPRRSRVEPRQDRGVPEGTRGKGKGARGGGFNRRGRGRVQQEETSAGKCSTAPSLISICVSVLQFAATEHTEKCTISSQFAFQSSILRCSIWVYNGEWPEVAAILELGDFLVVVQLIHRPTRTKISWTTIEKSHQDCCYLSGNDNPPHLSLSL